MNRSLGTELARRLAAGDLSAAAAVLNLVENTAPEAQLQVEALLDEVASCNNSTHAHIIGITGSPGAGKSTLISRLVPQWRERDKTVAVLTVDPSSPRSGGSLLGDRARISPGCADDRGVFIRSTAIGAQRAGAIARSTRAATRALAVAFDIVVIETVGVGQNETDIRELADTVLLVIAPASSDGMQFLKAGVMEIPDVIAITKADLSNLARRTETELRAASKTLQSDSTPPPAIQAVSAASPPAGIAELIDQLDKHRQRTNLNTQRLVNKRANALADFSAEHGARGIRALGGLRAAKHYLAGADPALNELALVRLLEQQAERLSSQERARPQADI